MSTVIYYENEFNQSITEHQAEMSDAYLKITKFNNLTKIKEEYVDTILSEVTYYQDNESLVDIFQQFPSLNKLDIVNRIEIRSNYIRENILTYQKDGTVQLHAFNIEHILTGKSICFGQYHLQTLEIINESVVKMKYDVSGNVSYSYYYDASGKINVIEEESGEPFCNEFSVEYYNDVLPLLP